ncbi:hypothetical protein ACFMPD_13040 [Sedimentitalea sp. HM32M-2]|uniref:hypothetical protein n=1 Tax=Sedimentitalea sp. HM32M-2 TaxID=3351566 RepID=UPI0036423B28
MILDPDFGDHASRPDGPQSLYRAVLARAVLDLFGKALPASGGDDETLLARQEALFLLTRSGGAWAESRVRLCGACGIDPDALRLNILRILDGGEIVGADARNAFGGIEIARSLWKAEQAPAPRPKAPKRKKRDRPPRGVSLSYSEVRSAVLPLLSEPRRFKDLIVATGGEYSEAKIRKVLENAIGKGEVVRDEKNRTYALAA